MKKAFTTFSVLVAITISVNAQTYQPFPTESGTWTVIRCWFLFQPGWYDHYTISIEGDTLYDGQLFKKLYITEHQSHGPAFDSIYPTQFFGGIREINKQIFIFQKWASVDTTVHLVYDFNNTNVGDTIYTSALAGPSTTLFGHLVTATDSVLIGTQYHKRLHLQDPSNAFNTEYWIEGVGSSWGLPFASFWSITDNSYDLNCFYKDQEVAYINPSPTYGFCTPPLPEISCDPIPTSLPEAVPKKIKLSLFPNPAYDIVTLDINKSVNMDLTVNFYDVRGILVQSEILKQNQAQISIRDLSNGIYIVTVKSKDFIESNRLLIQR